MEIMTEPDNPCRTERTAPACAASPTNAHYDAATLHAIIDDAYLCHIAFADENGTHCIPTACWREASTCTSMAPTAAA
jgi:hypothetical protein